MSNVSDIRAKHAKYVADLETLFSALGEKVDKLQAAVAGGGVATQAEIDELSEAIDAAQTELVAKAQAIVDDNA